MMNERLETSADILAQCMHDINPARTAEEWREHIDLTKDDPKKFFGDNGQGYEEYIAFVNTYDKDKHERKLEKERKKKGL